MTEIERLHEERINALDRRVDVLGQKVDDFIAESRALSARQDARIIFEFKFYRQKYKNIVIYK